MNIKNTQRRHPYFGLTAALATMHSKEVAIALPFKRHLHMKVEPTSNLDTDQFGTFTGEIPRKGTAVEAALLKAKKAIEIEGTRFGIGSEGSFGPHPEMPFCPVNREVLAFCDQEKDMNIVEHLMTLRTNYFSMDISKIEELSELLGTLKFPTHGVIISLIGDNEDIKIIAKGVREYTALRNILSKEQSLEITKHFRISTDMRAHMNPTRMGVIRALATRVARRLSCLCPRCEAPGFGEQSLERGVPCSWCGEPTNLPHSRRIKCPQCHYSETKPLHQSPDKADPGYCNWCNP